MRRFLAALALMTFATSSAFAVCSAGYYEQSVDFTAPTSDGNGYGYYDHDGSGKNNTSPVNLSAGQWRVTWTSSGTAVGEVSCNGTSGTYAVTTSPSDSMSNSASGTGNDKHCWCKVIQWIPNSGSSQALPAAWVFLEAYTANYCASDCAHDCAFYVYYYSNFRSAVFGAVTSATQCNTCPDGGTSNAGATAVTQCYKRANRDYTDSKGTYHFTEACYYTE